MPNPIKSLEGLSKLAGVGVESGRTAVKELLRIIKEGAQKDPAKVFLAERLTGPRVPKSTEIQIPEGFTLGTTSQMARAPGLTEKAAAQEKVYSQFRPIGQSMRGRWSDLPKAESIRSLEELGSQTSGRVAYSTPPLSGRNLLGRGRKSAAQKLAKLSEEQVRSIRKASQTPAEIAKQLGVSESTVLAIQRRDSYQWVK